MHSKLGGEGNVENISGFLNIFTATFCLGMKEILSALHDGHCGGDADNHDDFCVHCNIQGGEHIFEFFS